MREVRTAMEFSSVESDVLEQVEQGVGGLLDDCRLLVEAPSVNPPGDTRAVADVAADLVRVGPAAPELVALTDDKPSVVVSCEGSSPGPHVVMNVHLDTMEPGDETGWSVPPFALTDLDGRWYGLGMGNMKGAVAAMALAYRSLVAHRDQWRGRVTFTGVSDEVVFGDHGAAHLLATRPGLAGDALLCGEGPGWMRLAVAEKGVLWLRLTARGEAGHASRARSGTSPIVRLARAIEAVDALGGEAPPLPEDLAGVVLDADDPSGTLTVNTGRVEAGTFVSQLPRQAVAELDLRVPPGMRIDQVESRVRSLVEWHDVSVERIKGWDPNWSSTSSPLVRMMRDVARLVRGQPPELTVRSPASDATRWRSLGVPAVCYGPQPTLSAGIDDHALASDVADCARVYALAALRLLSVPPNDHEPSSQRPQEDLA